MTVVLVISAGLMGFGIGGFFSFFMLRNIVLNRMFKDEN